MANKVKFSSKFRKQYQKSPNKIREAFDNRLKIFLGNPKHPQLHIHNLTGKYLGYKSLNITGDWRALFREIKAEDIIYFFDFIGTHSQLYK